MLAKAFLNVNSGLVLLIQSAVKLRGFLMKENKIEKGWNIGTERSKVSHSIVMDMTFNIEAFGSNFSWH